MMLADALPALDDRVVVFVGGGGKTSSMYRLARELASAGRKAIVTTTTHIIAPREHEAQALVLSGHLDDVLQQVRRYLETLKVVGIGSQIVSADGKMKGIPPEWVDAIAADLPGVYVLVEGDGSAGRPFKAPADHEPVIPGTTTLVVPVVGIDVIGRPLGPDAVHRPERVASITGIREGDPITVEIVSKVMLHPNGAAKGAPSRARVVQMINKVDDVSRLEIARRLGRRMLDEGAVRVVIARVRHDPPVWEVLRR